MTIFEFEKKYQSVLENIEEWNYLRIRVGEYLLNKAQDKLNLNNNKNSIERFKEKFKVIYKIKNLFYGFRFWFRKYDYLFFGDSSQRKRINNIYYHRFFDSLYDILENDKKMLFIETPILCHYKQIKHETVVSEVFLKFLKKVYTLFYRKRSNTFSIKLKYLLAKEQIELSLEREIAYFHAEYFLYKTLLKLYKPKKIFLTCYYSRFGLIKAANELNIPIIEFQHGVVNQKHFGYVSQLNLLKKQNYLPNYLLSFGEKEAHLKNRLIKNVIPIGSFYIDYLVKNFNQDNELCKIIKKYNIVIGISMQDADWERKYMIDFVNRVSALNKDILYLIIPRTKTEFNFSNQNIIVYDKLDCYQIIMHCNIHLTLYSSCVLEAPSLGIPNILLNYDNIAYDYYSDFLDKTDSKYINDEKEFNNVLHSLININKNKLMELNVKNIKPNYIHNLKQFLKENN